MTISQPVLNSFERILLWSAVGIGSLVIAIRLATALYLYFSR